MPELFNSVRALGDIPSSHRGRLRFLPHADRSAIAGIRFGVLFVMAFWSGSSRLAFVRLKQVLSQADPSGRLELVVADIDGFPELETVPEFIQTLHGNGETAWIKDGQIVNLAHGGSAANAVEEFTRQLLDSATQS